LVVYGVVDVVYAVVAVVYGVVYVVAAVVEYVVLAPLLLFVTGLTVLTP